MKLVFKVREPATFFHYLDSISLWSIHTRKKVHEHYKKRCGISAEEEGLLKEYTNIRKKYQWRSLDSDFYLAKDFKEAHAHIKKRLTKEEYETLSKIIKHFRPQIHSIWIEWKELLLRRKKQLEKEQKKHNLKALFEDIIDFYEAEDVPKETTVHLLVNPFEKNSGGGANIEPRNNITVEPLFLKSNDAYVAKDGICTIIHEIIHIIESCVPRKKWVMFQKKVRAAHLDFEIFHEAIADTISPDGYLMEKYELIEKERVTFHHNIKKIPKKGTSGRDHYEKSRFKLSAMLYEISKKQLAEHKSIFEENYIEKCIEKYKEMKKKFYVSTI